MSKFTRRGVLAGTVGAAAFASAPRLGTRAFAQGSEWPQRPVRFIVPLAPGGATDMLARLVGEHMRRTQGQAVLIEYRAGAAGTVALEALSRAAPDGTTKLFLLMTAARMNRCCGS